MWIVWQYETLNKEAQGEELIKSLFKANFLIENKFPMFEDNNSLYSLSDRLILRRNGICC